MINFNIELPQWFTIFLTKIILTQEPKQDHKFIRTDNWVMNYTSLSLENFKGLTYIHLIDIEFGVLIL